jgi:aminopeptidase N
VTLASWSDIWLNEAFATYGEWLWLDHIGLDDLDRAAEGALEAKRMMPGSPTGSPRVDELFGFNSYQGGAVVLHALRGTIGDEAFFEVLRSWVQDNIGTSRSTADLIELASKVAGEDLTDFFETWLYSNEVPAVYPSAE